MMKKTSSKIIAVLVLGALLLGGLNWYNQSKLQKGSKQIQIVVSIDENGTNKVIYDKTTRTDALKLGDLLDELVTANKLSIDLSGNKTDAYGRFILGIEDYKVTDMAKGPWWLYNSTTNPDCVAAGYCAGIDMAPIYDKDIFTFTFTSTY